MSDVEYSVGVKDQASSEIAKIKRSLTSIGSVCPSIAKKIEGFGSSLKGARTSIGPINSILTGLRGVATSAGATGDSVGFFGRAMSSAVGGVVGGAALAGLQAVGGAVINSGVAFAKTAASALSFREDTLMTFEVLTKSSTKAAELYKSAIKMAAETPFDTQQVIDSYKKLLAAGVKVEDLGGVFRNVGDFAAGMGGGEKLDQIIGAMGKLRASGKMTGEVMAMLSDAGLAQTDVYAALGKTYGKSAEEVQKMQEQGKISADDAAAAIQAAIQKNFGGMMAKQATTATGLWSTLMSRPFELFNAAAAETKGPLASVGDSVKSAIGFLGDAFDPDKTRGKSVVELIQQISGLFIGLIPNKEALGGIFDKLVVGAKGVVSTITAVWGGLKEGFSGTLKALEGFLPTLGVLSATNPGTDTWKQFGSVIGSALGYGIVLISGFATACGWVVQAAAWITAAFKPLVDVIGGIFKVIGSAGGAIGKIFGAISAPSVDEIYKKGRADFEKAEAQRKAAGAPTAGKPGIVPPQVTPKGIGPGLPAPGAKPGTTILTPGAAPGQAITGPTAAIPMPTAMPMTAPTGPSIGQQSNTFSLNVSGAGLTPDQIAALCQNKMQSMFNNLQPGRA